MKRRDFGKAAVLGSAMGILPNGIHGSEEREASRKERNRRQTNLLYIFPDQYRLQSLGIWNQPGFQGVLNSVSDPVVTPALDKLARESVLFTQATSTYPLCSPYRGMFMSGMYPANNGVENNCRKDRLDSLRHDVDCLTDVLHKSGYETAYIGKTHWEENENLFDESENYVGNRKPPGGHHMNQYDTYIPEGRGRHSVKYWFQCVRDVHKDPRVYTSDPNKAEGKRDGEQYRPGIYSPKLEADVIVDYLRNTTNQRDPAKPFCLIWAPNPPHNPYASEDDCDEFAYRRHYKGKSPGELLNRPNVRSEPENDARKAAAFYFANVTGIDKQVNRVLKVLDEIGETDNTVIVFTSDHGEMMGSHGLMGKNYLYDESFLVPFIIKSTSKLQHRLEDLMLMPVDIMPTLLGLLDLEDKVPDTVEGINYAEALSTGNFSKTPKPAMVPYMGLNKRGVRSCQYSLEISEDGSTRVFDNKSDPYQMNSVTLKEIPASDREELLKSLGRWLKVMNDPWYHDRRHPDLIQYPG